MEEPNMHVCGHPEDIADCIIEGLTLLQLRRAGAAPDPVRTGTKDCDPLTPDEVRQIGQWLLEKAEGLGPHASVKVDIENLGRRFSGFQEERIRRPSLVNK